ncbi:preprotein translocase subunit SecG [Porphyromonas gulae]|uniref:Protein-export membrane protein SecG n=2 Tax=Porphyromonas gulae TaxID=111105 RepID=A0A099WN44_9PORP|nr:MULTISPECIES: preprotein translocase subunit SecG [Porphyromonas]KGL47234.1 preprotein translocase subunit SecG [Porphyromonas gulae]KGL55484.1 preprotein translocase subunit SecG [Porphyromonas sp. COT-052 OH4946]KGN72694.1 preprotein translocase subunit SecG [Porphyromonas gulae]KGN75585.1 preprotein translocase subunit SecG [Porphyromonas gulae]KGN77885.1 preprotein translocase subunit SecG [Porphyromonas gulae]
MYIVLTILILLISLFLILVVVVQNSKGGGLAAGFASSNQIMGVRKTTDFLEKATWWSAGIIAVLAIVSTHFLHTGKADESQNVMKETLNKKVKEEKNSAVINFGGDAAATESAQPATGETTPEEGQAQ